MDWIYEAWPWYVAGPVIALVMILLLVFGKSFGFSSNLRTVCSIMGAGKVSEFFRFDWKKQVWNLVFLLGAIIGGYVVNQYMTIEGTVNLNPKTIEKLSSFGFENIGESYLPDAIFGVEALSAWQTWVFLIVGGIFVGFGARYAGGCTSGHAISGLSNLQLPSLIAVIGFFIGGLAMTHVFLPLFFN